MTYYFRKQNYRPSLLTGIVLTLLILVCSTVCSPIYAMSYGPSLVNFQGQLLSDQNQPYAPGTYDMEVSIYRAPAGGDLIWGPAIYDGQVAMGHASRVYVGDSGHFNIILGGEDVAGRELVEAAAVATTASLYVEFRAGDLQTATPIMPRQKLLSSPYAIQSYNVKQFNGFTVTPDNKVGIGVTNPATKLDVGGNMNVVGTTKAFVLSGNSVTVTSGTVQSNIEPSSLVVNGDLTVTGTIIPNGPISFPQQRKDQLFTAQNNGTFSMFSDPDKQWQCYLEGIQMNTPGIADSQCSVDYSNGSWSFLTSTSSHTAAHCYATCIKLK